MWVEYSDILFMSDRDEAQKILERLLAKGICLVKFTKADGTERLMECTRNFEIISNLTGDDGDGTKSSASKRSPVSGLVVAYDVQLMDWRSFRFERVSQIQAQESLDTEDEVCV